MSAEHKRRPVVLKANPPLSDKQFAIVSVLNPENPRQKAQYHALKIHDVCADLVTAKDLLQYYHDLDDAFDCYVLDVGKWAPLVIDPMDVKEVIYANKQVEELVNSKREQMKISNQQWHKKVDKSIEEIQEAFTPEGQAKLANEKEPAISMLYKIRQLEFVIKRRQQELASMREVYRKNYSKTEQRLAAKTEMPPITEVAPMQYTLLSPPTQESSPSSVSSDAIDQGSLSQSDSSEQLPSEIMQSMMNH